MESFPIKLRSSRVKPLAGSRYWCVSRIVTCCVSFLSLPSQSVHFVIPFFFFPTNWASFDDIPSKAQVTVRILFKKKKKSVLCYLALPTSHASAFSYLYLICVVGGQQRGHQVYSPPPTQCLHGTSQTGRPLCAEKASLGCSLTLHLAPALPASR